MKKIIRLAFVALIAMAMPQAANAQLKNILKNAASSVASSAVSNATGSSTTGSVVSSLLSNVLGTSTVSESNIAGTWTYSEPCVVMESSNVLSQVGGSLITNKVAKMEKKALTKIGFTSGKVVMTLNTDKTATITISGKSVSGTWSVSGSNLVLTSNLTQKSVKMNVSLSGSDLQVAMTADKLLTLIQGFSSKASTASSSLSSISSLLSKYNGLYLGLKFTK